MLRKFGLFTAALVVTVFATVQTAEAALVSFTTTGVFTSTGTATTTVGTGPGADVTITFESSADVVFTPSFTSFGAFVTSGGNGSFTDITGEDTFTLTINQAIPLPGGSVDFLPVATLNGQLRIAQSQAFVFFPNVGPVSVDGNIKYLITEADAGVAGRVNLNAPGLFGAPSMPSTIEGQVIPEPASMLLLGLGFLGTAAAARRRKAQLSA
jgi:hypothetical protein